MGLFKKKSDPISERARALNAEIAALESQIKKLEQTGDTGSQPANSSLVQRPSVTVATGAAENPAPAEIVFEKVDQKPLRSEPVVTPEHYNEMGLRKFDLPALVQRIQSFFRGKPSSNPKLVSYLAAGSVQGLRPLRYEKRVARNRFILFTSGLLLLLWGILAWVLHYR